MAERYYTDEAIEAPQKGAKPVTLAGSEAHHLIHVMRARAGDPVVLFDGSGAEFPSRVARVGRAEVELTVLERHETDRELPRHVLLAVSLPKGDRQRWLVEKAVELGVAELVPLGAMRSVAQPVRQALDRLRRAVVEASKQCGRNRLMRIAEPVAWPDFVAATLGEPHRLLAHPGSRHAPYDLPKPADRLLAAVGPEGGFTAEEVALAEAAGWRLVDLGPRTLRVETAALMLAALAGAGPACVRS